MWFEVLDKRFAYPDEREKAWDEAIKQAVARKCYVWVKICSDMRPFGFNSAVGTPDGGLQTG